MKRRETIRRHAGRGPFLAGLFLVLAVGGCAGGRAIEDNPFDRTVGQVQFTLRVENQNIHDATIFLRTGGRRQELGVVRSRGVEFFDFPWPQGTPLDVEIELAVGERHRLPPYPFSGGGRLELTVSSNLRQSSIRS